MPKATKVSAGLVMYRKTPQGLEFLCAHPGGPFWKNRDEGAWTVPKGEALPGETLLETAIREFFEETGTQPTPPFVELEPVTQKGGKRIHAWAFAGDLDPTTLQSNQFEMEWPPRSGRKQWFAEIDRAQFFSADQARLKLNPAQVHFVEQVERLFREDKL